MDPKQTLREILLTVQRIGQPLTKPDLDIELFALQFNVDNLLEWFAKGGFKPELTVFFDEM